MGQHGPVDNEFKYASDIPLSSKFNLRKLLIFLGEDTNILPFLSVGPSVSQVDFDLLTSIFPSDARSGARRSDCALYLCGLSRGGLGRSVTPVRRREDTNGDGDAGVKVQIAWLSGALLSNSFQS